MGEVVVDDTPVDQTYDITLLVLDTGIRIEKQVHRKTGKVRIQVKVGDSYYLVASEAGWREFPDIKPFMSPNGWTEGGSGQQAPWRR
jgi:hypothetical protein